MSSRPILYAEDDENDGFFLKRAFRQAGIANSLIVVPNGQEAMDYCSGIGLYVKQPLPMLMFLDLHMPKKSGMEVLRWIRGEPSLRTLPIIILTSSLQDNDVEQAYLAGANAYLVKPSQPEALAIMAKTIKDFWLGQNRFCETASHPPLPT
jgi:CheY-like chemotaxis protein